MNEPTQAHRELARWLLAQELGDAENPVSVDVAADRACGKLFQQLSPLVGVAGYQALLGRALFLCRVELPFLDGLRPGTEPGSFLGELRASTVCLDSASVQGGVIVVLARVLDLLATFIGEDLTLRLIRGDWPDTQGADEAPRIQETQP